MRQLKKKHLAKKKNLYFALADLGKAFDRVPMRKLCVEEWLDEIVQWIYMNAQSHVRSMGLSVIILWSRQDFIKALCYMLCHNTGSTIYKN